MLIEFISAIILVGLWGITLLNYPALPDKIPIHFNALGEANGFGNKKFAWVLPVLATLLFLGLTKLARVPHHFNYPVEITQENAERHYKQAAKMLQRMNFLIIGMFFYVQYQILSNPIHQTEGLGSWFLPICLCILGFLVLRYFQNTQKS